LLNLSYLVKQRLKKKNLHSFIFKNEGLKVILFINSQLATNAVHLSQNGILTSAYFKAELGLWLNPADRMTKYGRNFFSSDGRTVAEFGVYCTDLILTLRNNYSWKVVEVPMLIVQFVGSITGGCYLFIRTTKSQISQLCVQNCLGV